MADNASGAAATWQRSSYLPVSGRYDEMLDSQAKLRPAWRGLIEGLEQLGVAELEQRWQEVRQVIRENGVTFNVHGDPGGLDRPWPLDPLPLIIAAEEADALGQGLRQRAHVLEMVLADLYGPQLLLKEGLVPPELVFANPSYLRPCLGLTPPGRRRLHLSAVDLGRNRQGSWLVLGDRTQAPSGAGYSLENRLVLTRLLPEVFRDCRVQRLALFFRGLRDTLRGLAPHHRDNPRIVLLTPGPYNETYFEHAYLARYLGFTLVEGGDLTVRENRVFLKLLDGLQPVDVIWRRLDDDFCDPLELRGDSFLGVPGLVQAARSGNVAVANSLGSGLVESPAFLPLLPALCRRLLGESLRLPAVPTFWCGENAGLGHVLANLDSLVIKSAFPALRQEPKFGPLLSAAERMILGDQIQKQPYAYVGQELINLATTPVWEEARLQPRPAVLRAYVAASAEGFTVMRGGLTRVTPNADSFVVSLQQGGGSKDTWVLSNAPVSTFSLLAPSGQPMPLSRAGGDLPSRAADNLFWLGRYVERAEGLVRLLRVIFVRLNEHANTLDTPELPPLLRALTSLTRTLPGFVGEGAAACLAAPEAELFQLVFDLDKPGGLAFNLAALQRTAGSVRDRMSLDMWRVLAGLDLHALHEVRIGKPNLPDLVDFLNRAIITLSAFGGLALDSMTRGHAWRFLDLGRKVERAHHTVFLLKHTLASPVAQEGPLLEALLDVADSAMTYRRRYLSGVQAAPVLDLLLTDESNPRSVVFQLVAMRDNVDQLPKDPALPGRAPEQRLALALLTTLQLAEVEQLAALTLDNRRPQLESLLIDIGKELPHLSDAITRHFLSHLQAPQHLAGSGALP